MAENSKKFLWLGAAVSLFALIVVGAAFLLFAPGKSAQEIPLDMAGKAEPRQDFPKDYAADAPQSDNLVTSTTSAGDIIIVYGNDQTTGSNSRASQAKPAATTIYVTPSSTTTTLRPATQPAAQPVPQPTPAAPKAAVKSAPAVPTTIAPPAPKAAPAPTPAPVTTVKAPAKAAPAPASGDFWIQAGSFSVRDNADALKSSLAGKSLPAAISVKDVDGKSRYTVRVGPYSSRAEASKWLSAAQSVKGAEKAWITQ